MEVTTVAAFWVRTGLADQRHLAVIHEDPSRLLVSVRSSSFSMNAFVAHPPIEGSEEGENWWTESLRVAKMAPPTGCTLHFVDANGRVGSVLSECVGAIHADVETLNGHYFISGCANLAPVHCLPFDVKVLVQRGDPRRTRCVVLTSSAPPAG